MEKEDIKKAIADKEAELQKLKSDLLKPEVKKWYKDPIRDYGCGLWFPLSFNGFYEKSYGFSNITGFFVELNDCFISEGTIEADPIEVLAALKKEADRRYEGVNTVDRSKLSENVREGIMSDIDSFFGSMDTEIYSDKFQYKGLYVMDENGVWAEPVVNSDHDLEIKGVGYYYFNFEGKEFEVGKYKLVKV